MHYQNRSPKAETSTTGEACGALAEFGFEVLSESLPDSLGLVSLLFYAAALVLIALIWAGRTMFQNF